MSPTPTIRSRAARLVALLTAGALALGGLTALDASSAPPASAYGSLGALTTGDGPVAVAVSGSFAYVTNAMAGTVSVFDTTDWSPETTVTVGAGPYYVTPRPAGAEVWISNTSDGTITIIETSTNTVAGTITTGGAPRGIVFTADDSTAYVLNGGLGVVQIIDTTDRTFTAVGAGLTGFSNAVLSADESELYTQWTNADRIIAIDVSDGSFDYSLRPQLDGTARAITYSPNGTEIWLPVGDTPSTSTVVVMDATATTILDSIPLSGLPNGFAFSESGTRAFVSIGQEDVVQVIDTATRTVLGSTIVGRDPSGVAAGPGDRMAVAVNSDDDLAILGFDQERLAGANRFATAVAVSQRAFPSGASTVFVASGRTFPDALAAGPAAGALGGALLLTEPGSLPTVVRNEIDRLNPDTIYLVGGTGAVSSAVEDALKALQPNTIRLAGANRYATGAAIVEEVWGGDTVPEVFIATGRNYPDALSAGAVAAAEGVPVVLVDGSRSTVPQATIDLIADLDPAQITIAGGIGAVSAGIASQLDAAFTAEVRRLAGANRYETSAAINLDAYPTNAGVIYATGTGFADALAGAALAGRAQIPVYLVQPGCVPEAAIDAIWSGTTTNLFLLGGTGALSTAVESLTGCP